MGKELSRAFQARAFPRARSDGRTCFPARCPCYTRILLPMRTVLDRHGRPYRLSRENGVSGVPRGTQRGRPRAHPTGRRLPCVFADQASYYGCKSIDVLVLLADLAASEFIRLGQLSLRIGKMTLASARTRGSWAANALHTQADLPSRHTKALASREQAV